MYGKLFTSIYDGTLYGHWQAIVTMQTLIALSDADGIVDMTPQAIAARTSIPLDIINKGLEILAKPDPYTRTPGEDGKRIALIDEHRPWGWRLVNHAKYKALRNMEQKREADRQRIAEKRKKNNDVAIESQPVANVAHTDTDTDTDTDIRSYSSQGSQLPTVLTLPLREGGEFSVSSAFVAELEPLYPNVDVPTTLREMKAWLVINTDRRKTKRGIRRFISNWLQSEQEKHGG